MGTGRFERLERERLQEAKAPRPSVEARFGGAHASGEATAGPPRSGAPAARFGESESPGRIRVLDTDEGQGFVRCAECRADNFANATRCTGCGADLLTARQRAFNAALWQKLREDQAESDREVEALRARRASADREQAEAMRRAPALLRELERRRELGLPLDDADDVSDPLRAMGRALGRSLGRALGRLLGQLVRPGSGRS